jgi:glyceraldehyde-3-phosphate dehydrogenase (NADP+)
LGSYSAVPTTTELESLFPLSSEVPSQFRVDPKDNPARYLIDGKVLVAAKSEPVTSRVGVRGTSGVEPVLLGYEAQLGDAEAKLATEAAQRAWRGGEGEWPAASPERRIAAIEKFAARVEAQTERVALLLMYEIGKALPSARDEVTRSVEYMRNTVVELRAMVAASRTPLTGQAGKKTHYALELRRPLGKVLCVAPFNYPVNEFLTTVVPALLMGNVVIAKTPRFGMLANQALLEAFAECFPPGVVAVLPGNGRAVIPPLMSASEKDSEGVVSAAIDSLAFIGSEGAANAILKLHPTPTTLHRILGLGSKNPAVVLEGADVPTVVAAVTKGALGFNGQRCTAEKIIFVPRAMGEAFAAALGERVAALKLGMPWVEGVGIVPLPEDNKLAAMRAYVDDACAKGARVVNSGGGEGHYSIMRPAVLYPVDPTMRIFHEEQFGPVVPVVPYDSVEQVIAWQRASPFGQQAGVWGPDEKARPVAMALSRFVARVNLNDVCQRGPDSFGFTATDKSGFGTLSLKEALLSFSRPVLLQSPDAAALGRFVQ